MSIFWIICGHYSEIKARQLKIQRLEGDISSLENQGQTASREVYMESFTTLYTCILYILVQ